MRPTVFAITVALVLLVGASGAAVADQDKDKSRGEKMREAKSDFRMRGDKWVLHNDDIAVWFAAGKNKARPDLRVAFNDSDDEKSGYRVKLLRICEVDESLKCSGKYPRINLAKSDDWNVVTEKTNDSLTLTMVRAEAQGIVTLVWHLDTNARSVKYDVQIDNWRWENTSHKLLLDQVILGRNLVNATGDAVDVADSGYIRWATTAETNLGQITVSPMMKSLHSDDEDEDEDEYDHNEKSGAHLQLLFNGTGGYSKLDYDPEFGIASGSTTTVSAVPSAGLLVGLAAIAVAAVVLGRKR